MSKKETIYNQLTKLAFQESIPFCYGCYIKAPTDRCYHCGSDDLMRLVEGFGCEYGTEWVVEKILKENLEPINKNKVFEEMVEDCYSIDTKIGWLELSTVNILKTMDEVAWDIAKDEYISSLEEDEEVISFDDGSTYFWASDIENLIKKQLREAS